MLSRFLFALSLALLGLSSSATWADELSTRPVAESMTQAATRFLETLSDEERAKVLKPFDDPARMDWHNIPKATRKGLQIRDMSEAQRQLCHSLLKAGLSESGYAKAVKVMSLEANLKVGEQGLTNSPLRDPERYFLSVFGQPALTGAWGWSFEGHHLSLNFVVREGEVIADSPSFWGANPATVHVPVEGGPVKGTRTLADEEQFAFDLMETLNKEQLAEALIAEKAPAEYRDGGRPKPPRLVAEGVSAKELFPVQLDALKKLLRTYSSHLAEPLAARQMAEIEADGWDKVYFAWAGAVKPGIGHYYRVEGPSFILEFVNVQSDPAGHPANHIHSVWRNPKGDFGTVER